MATSAFRVIRGWTLTLRREDGQPALLALNPSAKCTPIAVPAPELRPLPEWLRGLQPVDDLRLVNGRWI